MSTLFSVYTMEPKKSLFPSPFTKNYRQLHRSPRLHNGRNFSLKVGGETGIGRGLGAVGRNKAALDPVVFERANLTRAVHPSRKRHDLIRRQRAKGQGVAEHERAVRSHVGTGAAGADVARPRVVSLTRDYHDRSAGGAGRLGGVAEWLCRGLQSRVRRFDFDPAFNAS